MALCHSERSEESNHINIFQILHGVYPEHKIETLRFTQGDKWGRVQDDKSGLFTRSSSSLYLKSFNFNGFSNLIIFGVDRI
jgi:hypothetical protein